MKRLAVLGRPIAHSRSPAMHNAALRERGLDGEWSYEALDVGPEEFERFVLSMASEGFAGANVTIPHKHSALDLADQASEVATGIGAANTLSFADGRIVADNTDAPGLIGALEEAGATPAGARALVLGAGGAGRAAAWALREAGARVTVANRTAARAEALADQLRVESRPLDAPDPLGGVDLLVNTTSVGLHSARKDSPGADRDLKQLGFRADDLHDRLVVVDMAYGPVETELAAVAKARKLTTIDGLDILVHQGAASFRLWTGIEPPMETMRRAAKTVT